MIAGVEGLEIIGHGLEPKSPDMGVETSERCTIGPNRNRTQRNNDLVPLVQG